MSSHPQFPYLLYLVISETACPAGKWLEVARQAIAGGVDIVQLREKNCTTEVFLEKAKRLKAITDHYDVPLIINDNLAVAIAVDAAGIHVGNSDIPPVLVRDSWRQEQKMIGYSIEQLNQLDSEQMRVADHLGISPVFSSRTKTDTITEWGLEGIRMIRERTDKPLVAIGNMHAGNAAAVMAAGADCIAVVSAICSAANPQQAAYVIKNELLK